MTNDYASISMKIRNHQTVTGSEMKLVVKNGTSSALLVDNGAFQDKEGQEFPEEDYSAVEAAFLTHAHIDHSGGLANMAKQVHVPVYATPSTSKLIIPMINDMYNVMAMHGREFTREDEKAIAKLKGMIKEAKLYSKIGGRNYDVTFIDNAHILGASMLYLRAHDDYRPINILFSGDYREEHPFIRTHGINNFLKNNPVDLLVLESTYGNRDDSHIPFSDSVSMLEELLVEGVKKGDVLMGSFSVDRTPVLLYMINQIQRSNPELADVPVYLDGGLAIQALNIYKESESKFKCCWADIVPKNLRIIDGKMSRKKAQSDPTHKITLATNGQYNGGSIVSWVMKLLPDPNATFIQSGYIAHPIGKQIFEAPHGEIINYSGAPTQIMAKRVKLIGTSAHAGRPELENLVERCVKVNPNLRVALNHGELDALLGLRSYLASRALPYENIYIQGENQHFEINKHTLASGNILVDDV